MPNPGDECALYTDAGLYDLLFPGARNSDRVEDESRRQRIQMSEQFYVEEARRANGRVLELACGSGRLTVPIAQSGVDVTGADLSGSMLAAARAKALAGGVAIEFVSADMRRFDLNGPFATILIPGNSLLHLLTNADLKLCLKCVRRHLEPGGRLVFDVSKWDLRSLITDPVERRFALRAQHPSLGEMTVEETADYDASTQVRHVRWHFSAMGAPDFRVIDYRLRVIFPQELLLLIEGAGFRLEDRFGEFPREPFVASSPRQVCVCSVA